MTQLEGYRRGISIGVMVLLGVFLILLPSVNAESIGTFKQGSLVELYQTCNNCTYCNITAIKYPNSSVMVGEAALSTSDNRYYSYSLSQNTSVLGNYKYCYICGNTEDSEAGCIDFEITPSGFLDTTGFYWIILFISFGIIILGIVFIQDPYITLLGTIGLYFVSIHFFRYGIANRMDTVAWISAVVLLAVAMYISVKTVIEILAENY